MMDIRGRKMKKPPACVQCRRRKIGCDRGKPICGNCAKSHKTDCFYPDVPGAYVTSSPAPEKLHRSDYQQRQHLPNQQSREATIISHHANSGIVSMEQIRDYNTRLQLLTAQDNRNSPVPADLNLYHGLNPKDSNFDDYSMLMNYYESPTIFDLMTSMYSQEEVLLKEMKFLTSRYKELQNIIKDNNLESEYSNAKRTNDDDDTETDELVLKKQRLRIVQEIKTSINNRKFIDAFKDVDPEFLDDSQIFSVFNKKTKFKESLLPIKDSPNTSFDIKFLICRDEYLARFYHKLGKVVKSEFQPQVDVWNKVRSETPIVSKADQVLRFPAREVSQQIISKYIEIVAESSSLIPILKPNELLSSVEQLFGREPIFTTTKLNLGQVVTLGYISVCLLLSFESNASTVLIPLKDEQLLVFDQLRQWVPQLKSNLEMVKFELEKRKSYSTSIDVLKFIALYKFYQMISSDYCEIVDYDEDIHLARQLSLNNESKNQSLIILWNFIYKNYCWRHLYKGEIPDLVSGPELNSSLVIDPLLTNDIGLLNFQIEMVKYLHSKEELISMQKLQKMKELYKVKLNDQNKRCFHTSSLIHSVMNALIYRNSTLFMNYYLLLQYEELGDKENFKDTFTEFLQLIQESLFYIFSNLASLKFAGYEFIFSSRSFMTLDNICQMLLGLHQRSTDAVRKSQSSTEENTAKKELKEHSSLLVLLLHKVMMLLQDYSKNLKVTNVMISKLTVKITTMLEYVESDLQPAKQVTTSNNGFENADTVALLKDIQKLRTISESLIKTDFFSQRPTFTPKDPSKLGITASNFAAIYSSFYS
ncbi:hypothetical protein Kpol_1023p41 [Vanderwaltozyma polyspora DSM 70294]|uniref:Zn(2)-C6 fungal-type domain-containing protein n=1 Tax=Vanderwaltozyma polyspora (strain ATCC 22028 / DSM 70294 / BCRC 21397 / CBS 2163 / NBRC 10782 / NRRL Y-8283 / UCD 57-17) TaxID=436907 RepID=A7TFR4_VANPO|nr:uncharacterized protein Kpol_1023p41 [Vanderwaltozyma polyspora DSM 70294]EDO18872.1 hypothetical protein Kpol_1023p41 [Vanderwaltozyma polyspora DSM 70294]